MTKNLDFVKMAKAQASIKKKKVRTDLMQEGESLSTFMERVYRCAIWRVVAASAMTDKALYALSDKLRETHPELDDLRAGMVDYYEKFNDKINVVFDTDEDFIPDFRYQYFKSTKRMVDSFTNCATKVVKKLGLEDYETIALLCVFIKMADTIRDAYRVTTEPLGILAKHLPDHVSRPMFFLELAEKKALKIIVALDPDDRETNGLDPKLDDTFTKIVDAIVDEKIMLRALKYAEKQSGK